MFYWPHYEFKEYKLLTKDAVQKTYSEHTLPEVPFIIRTKHTKLVEHYAKEFKEEIKSSERTTRIGSMRSRMVGRIKRRRKG